LTSCTLIVPCYNEECRIKIEEFLNFLDHNPSVSILFVDDGSVDGTYELIGNKICKSRSNSKILRLQLNQGKAEAVRLGFLQAAADGANLVGYWDADLSTPLTEAPAMITFLAENPQINILMASRVKLLGRNVVRSEVRHYLGRVFATAASIVLALGVYDTQCGAKIFRTSSTTRDIFIKKFHSRWIFDVEIIARYLYGISLSDRAMRIQTIYEYPLNQWRDVPGSRLKWTDFFKAIFELLAIAKTYPLWMNAFYHH
jgi:dolichyl-phosphate beta-glucosyltransferase